MNKFLVKIWQKTFDISEFSDANSTLFHMGQNIFGEHGGGGDLLTPVTSGFVNLLRPNLAQ